MQRHFLRRIQKRTDYKQRLGLLKSGLHRIVIRKSINDIRVQVVQYDRKGDITRLEDRASSLKRLGWKAHCANMPAAYLIGYKIGRKMLASGIKQAVADIEIGRASCRERV